MTKALGSVIGVDIGLNATGWAAWSRGDLRTAGSAPTAPSVAGIITISSAMKRATREGTEWSRRIEQMVEEFSGIAMEFEPVSMIAIEWPEFRAGSAQGHAAASTDSLTQLAAAAGAIVGLRLATNTVLVPVSAWKGMLPKEITWKRMLRAIGSWRDGTGSAIESHARDAVGIGLFAMGFKLDGRWFA